MKIGIDIDGVLTNIENLILEYGIKFCYDNKIEYNINIGEYNEKEILNISKENIEKFWNKYLGEYVQNGEARIFAQDVIKKLKANNKIYLITSRNETGLPKELYGKMQEMTKEWLKKQEIEYDKLIFSQEDKRPDCIKEQIDVMIEDSPSNILMLKEIVHVFCFNNFYNQNIEMTNVTRVFSWYDVLDKIEKYKK